MALFIPMIRHCCPFRRVNSNYKHKHIVVKLNTRKDLSKVSVSDFRATSPVAIEGVQTDGWSRIN